MKKLFALALALAMLLSATALAEAADYTGMWYLNGLETEGQEFAPASFGIEMTMELKEDGTAIGTTSMAGGGEAETVEGTWALEGDGITVTLDGDPASMTLQDDALRSESDGMTMIFGREKVEVEMFEPAAAKADATLEDFAGEWITSKIGTEGVYLDCSTVGGEMNVSIEGTTITLDGFVFTEQAVETEFVDGALVFAAEDPASVLIAGVKAQALEDGTISLVLTISEDMEFILTRAE